MGNLDAKRDWGYAADYVEAMWLMLQQRRYLQDFVIATGESHSVRELVEIAFDHVGMDYRDFVEIDPALYRPAEVDHLRGDCTKARNVLGWQPKMPFADLVRLMVDCDMTLLRNDARITGDETLMLASPMPLRRCRLRLFEQSQSRACEFCNLQVPLN